MCGVNGLIKSTFHPGINLLAMDACFGEHLPGEFEPNYLNQLRTNFLIEKALLGRLFGQPFPKHFLPSQSLAWYLCKIMLQSILVMLFKNSLEISVGKIRSSCWIGLHIRLI